NEMARTVGAQLDARAARLEELIRAADERIGRLNSAPAPPDSNGHPADAPSAPSPVTIQEEIDPRHAQIYALLDEGLTSHQIADRLGRPEGEVELIIALRPRRRATLVPSPLQGEG